MIVRKYTYHILFSIFFISVYFISTAQDVEIKTDKNQILIGERIQYDLRVFLPTLEGYTVNFGIPDSIPHFETIEREWFDTTKNANGSFVLHRKFIFTSFDSGSWYIPALPVTFQANNRSRQVLTDSVLINVGYAPADTTTEIRDIKPIMDVEVKNYFWYYVAGAVLTALVISLLIYNYIVYRRKIPKPVLHSALSPYDEAINAIKDLNKYRIEIAEELKEYHTELGFIFKRYFSRITDTNLLNKTTGGLLVEMKQKNIDAALITSVAQVLRAGDAVKFAKHIPSVSESENCATELKLAIEKIDKEKPSKNHTT